MTKFEVTLKQLRQNGACVDGYNKLVCALKGVPFYGDRETYIRYKHDAPIPLAYIADSNGIRDAIWCLRCNKKEFSRDSRLYAVWCARQVQHLMQDQRSIDALDVAEKYAYGKSTKDELTAAWSSAMDARAATWAAARAAEMAAALDAAGAAAWNAALDAARAAKMAAALDAAGAAALDAALDAARAAKMAAALDAAGAAALDAQKDMFIKMCNGEAPWQLEVR